MKNIIRKWLGIDMIATEVRINGIRHQADSVMFAKKLGVEPSEFATYQHENEKEITEYMLAATKALAVYALGKGAVSTKVGSETLEFLNKIGNELNRHGEGGTD